MPRVPARVLCQTPDEVRAAADRRYRWGIAAAAAGIASVLIGLSGLFVMLSTPEVAAEVRSSVENDPLVVFAGYAAFGVVLTLLGLATASSGADLHELERRRLAEGRSWGGDG